MGAANMPLIRAWQKALSKTAAHSALTLDGIDSSDFSEERFAEISDVEAGPADGGLLAIGTHNGYQASHGILHHRQLYLTSNGHNLRGADRLEYTGDLARYRQMPNCAFIYIRVYLPPCLAIIVFLLNSWPKSRVDF